MRKDFHYGNRSNIQKKENQIKENQEAHEFFKTDDDNVLDCPFCQKPVKYLSTAINVKGYSAPAHFDCVIKHIQDNYSLQPNQKISYLGKGVFGIIEAIKESPGFVIKEKIEIEDVQEESIWKQELASRIKNFEHKNDDKEITKDQFFDKARQKEHDRGRFYYSRRNTGYNKK